MTVLKWLAAWFAVSAVVGPLVGRLLARAAEEQTRAATEEEIRLSRSQRRI